MRLMGILVYLAADGKELAGCVRLRAAIGKAISDRVLSAICTIFLNGIRPIEKNTMFSGA